MTDNHIVENTDIEYCSSIINKPIPIRVDFKNIRGTRQKHNNLTVYNSIKNNNTNEFTKNINHEALKRLLDELGVSFDVFWEKCRVDDMFSKLASSLLSINASRQGTNDEKEQLRICNLITTKCGIYIETLCVTALRPTKYGNIVSKSEMKKTNITKDCCLKSFDGKITGKIQGYISAKISYGNGGHQDNVFEELDIIAKWWSDYKQGSSEILLLLVDTDLHDRFECLRLKYVMFNNIIVCNHYEFQEYIISNYYI